MHHSLSKHLIVVPTAKINGAERVMFNLAYYLLEKGDHVTLVTMSRGKSSEGWNELEKHSNFKWIAGPYSSEKSSLIPISTQLLKLSIIEHFDYILSTHIHVNSYLNTLKKIGMFKKSKLISRDSHAVFERHKDPKKRFLFKLMYKFLYGEQNLLICQTELMKNSLISNLGFNPVDTTEVIPNPINLDYIKSNLHDLTKEKIIVACGRFHEVKQFNFLIDAFSKFSKKNPSYRLVLLGDGPLRPQLEAKANNLKVHEKVIFPGRVQNPFEWFSKAEIGVISSRVEGFPNVLLEMMASGTSKIVITPCTGGLENIPGLIITSNTFSESITSGLIKAAQVEESFTDVYQKYISDNHSIESYWGKLVKLSED